MPKVIKDNASALLKDYMTSHGIKVSWLAESLGISQQALTNRINREALDADLMIKICKILGLDINIFLSKTYTFRLK